MPDATVVALAEKFHWVEVNRDHTPEIPKRFRVSAYPSWLVLGDKDENVHRFKSFLEPAEFNAELSEGLRRHALYAKGEKWDDPPPRTDRLSPAGETTTLPAPSDAVPAGLVRLGDDLFVAQGDELFRLDPDSGAVRARSKLPRMTQDLATDGEKLYAITSGWSAGEPIAVLDPGSGETVREIVTAANAAGKKSDSRGLCWLDGELLVLGIYGDIRAVDPATGAVKRTVQCGARWVFGLAFDGAHVITVSTQKKMLLLDPRTLKITREVPISYSLRAVGHDGARYLLMEQPVFGFDRDHEPVRVWPRKTVIHRLVLGKE